MTRPALGNSRQILYAIILRRYLSDFHREMKMSVGVITVDILNADFKEDSENRWNERDE